MKWAYFWIFLALAPIYRFFSAFGLDSFSSLVYSVYFACVMSLMYCAYSTKRWILVLPAVLMILAPFVLPQSFFGSIFVIPSILAGLSMVVISELAENGEPGSIQYYCPVCNAPLVYGMRFCYNCSTKLKWNGGDENENFDISQEFEQEETIVCIGCGKTLPRGLNFCPYCGKELP